MTASIQLFTIGFTKKSAEEFFGKLQTAGVARVLDVRLNNNSQLAGFAKKGDLAYFLRAIAGMDYAHLPSLAPTQEMLDEYKKAKGPWHTYEKQFLALITARKVEETLDRAPFDRGCLLCSEDTPDQCHRRIVAEYLAQKWGNVEVTHLV